MWSVRDEERAEIMRVKVRIEQKHVDSRDKVIRELDLRCEKTVKELSKLKYAWDKAAIVASPETIYFVKYQNISAQHRPISQDN